MLKPLPKPRKTKSKSVGYWSKKADAVLQNIGRMMYEDNGCVVCGREYSCLHHIYTKGASTYLRYKWKNVVPICVGCHFKIHSHEPSDVKGTLDKIIEIKGQDWYDDLTADRNNNRYTKAGYTYYRDMYYRLEKLTPMELDKEL